MDKYFKIAEDVYMGAEEDVLYIEKNGIIYEYVPKDLNNEEDYNIAIEKYILLNDCQQVVRCKDCKFATHEISSKCGYAKWCNYFDRVVSFMGYCSWGEKTDC